MAHELDQTAVNSGSLDLRKAARERCAGALVQRHAVILVAAIGLLASCTSSTAGVDLPVSALRAEAASELAPPGAVVLRTVQAEPFNNITGHEAAFYGHLFGVPSPPADIHTFYDRELIRLGWRVTRAPGLGTIETDGWGWCKPKLYFTLSILDPRGYSRIPLTGAEPYQTVIDARLAGTDEGCPSG